MISPLGSPSIAEGVRAGAEVYAALRKRLSAAGHATGLGDEGGFAPELAEPEEVLEVIVAAITDAGYAAGPSGIAIALDPAASEFLHEDGRYHVNGQQLSSHDMVERYAAMVDRYPIWSIEDGLGESDREGWQELTARIGGRVQLVGDDYFCTNPAIITTAIADGIGNSALIKLNQIGTVSETLEAMAIATGPGTPRWSPTVRARPPTRSSPTSRSAPGAVRSRPEHPPAVNESPSTTGSSRSALTIRTCHTVWADADRRALAAIFRRRLCAGVRKGVLTHPGPLVPCS